MKRILFFFALVMGVISANAQTWNNVSGRWGYEWLRTTKALFIPSGNGAPSGTASLSGAGYKGQAALYSDTTNKKLYMFNAKDSTWTDVTAGGSGSVTSVSGTVNRITITNPTTTPIIDIASSYIGQASITTLGTIGTGVWNGTAIGPVYGGTGQTSVTTGDMLYGSASNTWAKLPGVATGNALISGGVGTAFAWGKIGLTTHVSGILPVANGGTGTATPALVQGSNVTITGTWPNQTINASGGGGGTTDTISITNDSLYTNSNVVKKAIPFQSFRNRKVAVQVDTILATSTSFGVSYGLSNSNQGNFQILADRLKMTLLNHSMGGLDIEAACVEVSNNIRPGVNKYMQVNAVGYNLLRYAGNNDSAYKQLQDGIRTIISTNIIDTIFYGDNVRVTQFGIWGTSAYATYGGKSGAFGGNGLYSNSNNDSLKIQITGDAIIVGYINQIAGGGQSGTFNIYVDNVLKKTINAKNACGVSDGTYSNQTTPGAVLLDGLGAGMHTVRIVNTQAKYIYFDYIATTKATNECAPVIVSLIPKMTAAGYAVSPANASDAIFNKGDSVIMVVVNEFSNYPVTVSYPNDYFNPSTQTQGDNVHPTEAGQAALAYANSIQIFTAEKVPAGSVSQWNNTSGGIYFPGGNVGIGSTATSPATALQIKSSAPAFRMDDTNGDNAAFYGNFTNYAQISINRNPSTGVFTNSGKAAAQISLKADVGEGGVLFYSTNSNNTSPPQRAIMDGLGNWGLGVGSPTAKLHLPASSTAAGSSPLKLSGGVTMSVIENGAFENDTVLNHLYFSIRNVRYQLDQQGAGIIDKQYTDANNSGTSETDLYTKTIAANTLNANGSIISFEVAGVFNDATATVNLQALFGGNGIAGAGLLTISGTGAWTIRGTIMRTGTTTARAYTIMSIDNSTNKIYQTTSILTGLDFTATNIIKVTGTAGGTGGGSNDITGQMWVVRYEP